MAAGDGMDRFDDPRAGERIVRFYAGAGRDARGRSLEDVLRFDDGALERVHDVIQWLFPLRERSGANPAAPTLDDAAVEAFRTRPELRAALRRSLDRMLAFYGLAWDGGRIVRSATFAAHAAWLTPENHNHLRLTRIITALRVLGERHAAEALFGCLTTIYDEERRTGRNRISARTYRYWSDAARR